MARGRRSYTPEERLNQITKEIAEHKESITKLKAEEKRITEMLDEKNNERILNIVKSSGKTIDELTELLKVE